MEPVQLSVTLEEIMNGLDLNFVNTVSTPRGRITTLPLAPTEERELIVRTTAAGEQAFREAVLEHALTGRPITENNTVNDGPPISAFSLEELENTITDLLSPTPNAPVDNPKKYQGPLNKKQEEPKECLHKSRIKKSYNHEDIVKNDYEKGLGLNIVR